MSHTIEMKPKHKGSKFIFDSENMALLWGRLPSKDGQLWNGEDHRGEKMQAAGNTRDDPTYYWGW